MSDTATAVRERPILFSDEMVRAILEGRKTQTRRVMVPQPNAALSYRRAPVGRFVCVGREVATGRRAYEAHDVDGHLMNAFPAGAGSVRGDVLCPYGAPGGRLYVREAWTYVGTTDPGLLVFRATYPDDLPAGTENVPADIRDAGYHWRPSIHMPRALSRLTLEIADVQVERVQEIGEGDAAAEGLKLTANGWEIGDAFGRHFGSARGAFRHLWDGINGPRGYGWDANPWVWAITFRRVED